MSDMPLTRRRFLAQGGALAAGLAGLPAWLTRAAFALDRPRRRLVVLFQRGAADGLNIVVPWSEPRYASLRPTIGLKRPGADGGCLDLDGRFGLHPALAPLLPLWKEGSFAVVHAAGSPDPTRSHFDAQDYMETGRPGSKAGEEGWLNRALGREPGWRKAPLSAVAVAPRLPLTLRGRWP
ncbi:MAG: hypothetical protein KGL53_16750, partial [Elusimicrobia bacterium]|nr:hypothetical protein [Elusimicrobiota bacterium]